MFQAIKQKVVQRFDVLKQHTLFVADVEKEVLNNAYLMALPEEERQSHTCNACRSFFNRYANVVAIVDGKIETLWDFQIEGLYSEVPKTLHRLLSQSRIASTFDTEETRMGLDKNRALVDNQVVVWHHFALELPRHLLFRPTSDITTVNSLTAALTSTRDVFKRGMKEIPLDVCQTVLDLIDANTLYRGAEFRDGLVNFMDLKRAYEKLKNGTARHLFCWEHLKTPGARIRNTAFGQLLVDMSEGIDMETAVTTYEGRVAPANYRRPTALVTPRMIADAEKFIKDNGYELSLSRRHATVDDVAVSDLLYVNRGRGPKSVFDALKTETKVDMSKLKPKQIRLKDFLSKVVDADSVQMLVEPSHVFVSLIAPEHKDAKPMFSWGNNFSWMYQNNLTDAITEKVKNAGGNTNAELRISLEWFNLDDLDLHVIEPSGNEICFSEPRSRYSDGFLDVDMNAFVNLTRTPVENIAFNNPRPGRYHVEVHNYRKRENTDFGFNVQIVCQGRIHNLSRNEALPDGRKCDTITFDYSKEKGLYNPKTQLNYNHSDRELFGVKTGCWQDVSAIMWSPNYWGRNKIGNQHLMVMLEGARVNEALRPFSNEYLHSDLYSHRRVFEILSERLKVQPVEQQFTGVGFSVTQNKTFFAKVGEVVYQVSATL